MPVEESLNKILKEMWRLDEILNGGVDLSEEENDFYRQNISVIKDYYRENNEYWSKK